MNIVVQLYLSLRVSSKKKNSYLWECQTANVWITTTKAQLWYFEDLGRQRFDISAPFFFSIRSDHSDISNFVSFAFSSPELLFAKNWNTKAFKSTHTHYSCVGEISVSWPFRVQTLLHSLLLFCYVVVKFFWYMFYFTDNRDLIWTVCLIHTCLGLGAELPNFLFR